MPAILLARDPAIGSPEYNAQSKTTGILTFVGICGLLALTIVSLRLYVRKFMLKFLGPDDCFMAIGMLLGIGVYICFLGEAQYGVGRHLTAISPEDIVSLARWTFYHNIIYLTAMMLVKVSICWFLIRLVKHRGYVCVLWGLLIFFVLYSIACLLTVIFACIPTAAMWDPALQLTAKCFSLETFVKLGLANSIIGMVTDILLATLPVPVILSMSLNKRTKIALCVVLGLGFIAVGAGAVKLRAQIVFVEDTDRLYHDRFQVWAATELYFGIIAASLPTLKPLIAAFLSQARNTFESSNHARRTQRRQQQQALNPGSNVDSGSQVSAKIWSEANSSMASPAPALSKEVGNYFSFMKKHGNDFQTECSRAGSIQLGTVSWSAHPMPERESAEDKKTCILRTRKVSTTTEPASASRAQSMPAESWPVKSLSRQPSMDGGFVLKAAQRSEEDLPRTDSSSFTQLVDKD